MFHRTLLATATMLAVAASPVVANPAQDAARTLDLSQRFTYRNVTSPNASDIFHDLKIESSFNPKLKMKNPDPAWIPGWDQLSLTDETQTAILQAAINRTWTAKVHEDFARYRQAWRAIDQRFRPELERIMAASGYYARATALAKLLADVRAQATADKVLYPSGSAPAAVGFIDDVVAAMVAVHRDAKLDVLLDRYLASVKVDLAELTANGRPFADDDTERDLFTAAAQKRATLETPALPLMTQYGKAFAAVRWPTSNERDRATEAARVKLVAANAAAWRVTRLAHHADLLMGSADEPGDPTLRWVAGDNGGFSPIVVTKVGQGVVELESKITKSTPYNCSDTYHFDANGERIYDCKYKHVDIVHAMTVKLPALPEGLVLAKGDEVELWADLGAPPVSTPTKVTYQLTARAIVQVRRGGQVVGTWW